MFAIEYFISYEVVQKIGWVLLHFVWQAAAVTFVLAFVLRILRRFSANTRYIAACFALLIVVIMPFVTMRFIKVETPPAAPVLAEATSDVMTSAITASEVTFQTPAAEKPAKVVYIQPEPVVTERHINFKERAVTFLEPKLSAIVTIWLLGVFALAVWHLGGYAQLQKLRRKMVKQVDSSLHDKLKVLAQKLGVTQTVQLLESALVQIPTVIGWLKPVILLPASAITGLSTEQLEAILAHELAHIKRYDYLVNIIQTIVEILGFYHPAVWWISHKIRCERENCCDDMAVAICGDKIHYAKALASMEEIRSRDQFAIAATGGNLFSRICRLIGKDSNEKNALSWIPALTVILLLIALAIPTTIAFTTGNIEKNSETQKENTNSDTKILIEAQVIQANDQFLNQIGILIDPNYLRYNNTLTLSKVDDSDNPFIYRIDSSNKDEFLRRIDESKNASYNSHIFMMSTSSQEVTIKSGSDYKLKSQELGRFLKVKPQLTQDGASINISCELITRQIKNLDLLFDLNNGIVNQNDVSESEVVEYQTKAENTLLSNGQTLLIIGGKLIPLVSSATKTSTISNIPVTKESLKTTSQVTETNEIILIKATIVPDEQIDDDKSKTLSDNVFTSQLVRINFDLNLLEPGQYVEIKNNGKRDFTVRQVNCPPGKIFPCYGSNIDFDIRSNLDFNLATKRYSRGPLSEHGKWDAHFTGPNTVSGNGDFSTTTLSVSASDINLYQGILSNTVLDDTQVSLVEIQIKPANKQTIKEQENQTDDKLEVSGKKVLIEMKVLEVNEKYLQKEATLKELLKGVPIPTVGMSMAQDPNKQLFSTAILDDSQTDSLFIQNSENSKVQAAPKLLVFDNETATIKTITEIPYVTDYTEPNEISIPIIEQKEVGFTGTFTPHIIPDKNDIILEYVLKNSIIAGYEERTYDENHKDKVPLITLREMESTALISRGKTFVANLGEVKSESSEEKKELIILIKPTIVSTEQMKPKENTDNRDEEDMIGPSPNEFIINTSGNTPTVKEKKESEEIPDTNMVQRTYDIVDIVYYLSQRNIIINNIPIVDMGGAGGSYGGIPNGTLVFEAKEIVNNIMNSIEPYSWYEKNNQANGTLYLYPAAAPKKLAVTNTHEVHTQIEKYLESVRESIDYTQVSIEMRYIYGSEQAINEILSSIGIRESGAAILDDTQVTKLIKDIQRNQNAKFLAIPKVTVLNDETAIFQNIGQQPVSPDQINPFLKITPHISQDKNIVYIDFDNKRPLEWNDSNRPPDTASTLQTRLTIPNGKTCALSIYENNQQDSSSDKKSLILIKPTIILPEEEKEITDEGSLASMKTAPANTERVDLNRISFEAQIFHSSDAFIKQLGLDANSLKKSDTWSKYIIDDAENSKSFLIDPLSADLLQKSIHGNRGSNIYAGIRFEALYEPESKAVIEIPTKERYLLSGKPSEIFKPENVNVISDPLEHTEPYAVISLTPEITQGNKIWLDMNLKINEFVTPYSELAINSEVIQKGRILKEKEKNTKTTNALKVFEKSLNTIISDDQSLLILGPNITESMSIEGSRPLIRLPILDQLFRTKSGSKMAGGYTILILIKPTIVSD